MSEDAKVRSIDMGGRPEQVLSDEVLPRSSSIIGRLSKYTDRTDLSELISSRNW